MASTEQFRNESSTMDNAMTSLGVKASTLCGQAQEGFRARIPSIVLCVSALAACLTSFPGSVPADTKLYLYLDPIRLISDSIWSWDTRLFSGWVPHQNVGYLWPSGPFFAFLDIIGSPDWIAHRLWIASLMIIAGTGGLRLARYLGVSSSAALITGAAYQFSPYILPYISRTSALLLPWSLLPWLILLAMKYAQDRRLRHLAVFGLLVFSSGGLNATALLMIAPGPLIWLFYLHRNSEAGTTSNRDLVSLVVRFAGVSLLVSLWWLAGLFIQGRYGAAVLSYSEALQSTSATSSAPEVLRGLGYWLFYDRGAVAPLTTAAHPYQVSIFTIAGGAALLVAGLMGIQRSGRWRAPLATMLLVGVVLAVGAHPYTDPNAVFSAFANNPKSTLSLALRSSTRAVPMVVLALAIGLGFLWHTRRLSAHVQLRKLQYLAFVGLILGNLPSAVNGDLIDRAILRPEELPSAWHQVAEYLDERFDTGETGAVLLLPGIESAAYRWGYPVDPILPGLSRKPLVTRDWLPLGSPALMDLLYAFDDSFQNGTADADSIAPVARMLGADTVMFVSSHQYERFDTVRPERAYDLFDPVPAGLTFLTQFGEPGAQRIESDTWTEESVAYPPLDLPEILLFSVDESGSSTRVHTDALLASTDGTGLVDLASSGVLRGSELTFSEASLDESSVFDLISRTSHVIISDSNRRRAHHWRGSQDVWGATEPAHGVVSVRDDFDSRLPIHPGQTSISETMVEASPVEAKASRYGAALRYHPEYRPRMAIDGDPTTAWRIGPDRPAVGHVLSLSSQDLISEVQILQPLDSGALQWITAVSIRAQDGAWTSHALDASSRNTPGQRIDLQTPARSVDIRIDALNDEALMQTSLGVGFAEVVPPSITSAEVIALPQRLAQATPSVLTYSLNRLRSDPFERWRDDPEKSLIRRLPAALSSDAQFEFEVRLSPRAADGVLAAALGWDGAVAQTRLHGSASWWGPAAFDGDPATAWRGPVAVDTRSKGFGAFVVPLTAPLEWLEIHQPLVGESSTARRLTLTFFNEEDETFVLSLDIPEPDSEGRSWITLQDRVIDVLSDTVLIEIDEIEPVFITDGFTGRRMPAPVTISELQSNAWSNTSSSSWSSNPTPSMFDTGCRSDLIFIDSEPISIRLSGEIASALRGEPVVARTCDQDLSKMRAGSLLSVVPGSSTGWDVDRILISSISTVASLMPSFDVPFTSSRGTFDATVPLCSSDCWIETPFGYSEGWSAFIDKKALDPPMRSAAGRSVWSLPTDQELNFSATWTPQRWMWVGLTISGATVVALLSVVIFSRVRRRATPLSNLGFSPSESMQRKMPSRVALAVVGFVLGAAFVSPLWGLAIAAPFLVLPMRWIIHSAITSVALGYLYVIIQQIRVDPVPGFGWPELFHRAHRPMLAVLIVFVVAIHAGRPPLQPPLDSPESP